MTRSLDRRPAAPDLRPVRVLVVDDDPEIPVLFQDIARRIGRDRVHVTVAVDSVAGAEAAMSGRFDVVVADYRMPGVDGLTLLGHAAVAAPGARRVLITGNHAFADVLASIPQGIVHEFLRKGADDPVGFLRRMSELPGSGACSS